MPPQRGFLPSAQERTLQYDGDGNRATIGAACIFMQAVAKRRQVLVSLPAHSNHRVAYNPVVCARSPFFDRKKHAAAR